MVQIRLDVDDAWPVDGQTGVYAFQVADAKPGPTREPPARYEQPWFVMFQRGAARLAADTTLSAGARRVLFALLARAGKDGEEWEVKSARTAEEAKVARTRVSSSVTELEQHGYLKRTRRGWVTFNPDFAWRGNAASREAALKGDNNE